MNNFLTRTLTGIFIVLIVIGGIWLHPISFLLLLLIIVIGSQLEFHRLVLPGDSKKKLWLGIAAGSTIFIGTSLIAIGFIEPEYLLLSIPLIISIPLIELFAKGDKHIEIASKVLLGVVYTTLPYSLMVFSAFKGNGLTSEFSPELVLIFFILLWINDTGAYLIGTSLGRHKLFERVSPKKTWEGFAGGLILTIISAWLIGGFLSTYTPGAWIICGIIVSVFATLGDLFESQIKRNAGVKDSGKILPGHGGFLDRFDGVSFAFPLVYLFLTFFG